VFEAVLRLRQRALRGVLPVVVAAAAFLAIFVFALPFPIIIAAAAAVGLIVNRSRTDTIDQEQVPFPRALRTLRVTALWLLIWLLPVVALMMVLGPEHVIAREATFFSQVAVVTFGGAYAALSYVAQHAVETLHWLTAGEMLDGLGLAETTPGPLIMVLEFVGFLAAFRAPGTLHPLVAGILGATITTWVIFAPCFLFIFAGAPYIEALRGHRRLNAALAGIMAAVVGVVLNLAVWFALHVLFGEVRAEVVGPARFWVPIPASLDPAAAFIASAAAIALLRFRANMFVVLGGGAVLGVILFN
jgi:chromate transporter